MELALERCGCKQEVRKVHFKPLLKDEIGCLQCIYMTRQKLLDLYFMEARAKLIDLAAFMDRVERGIGDEDFRMKGFRAALGELGKESPERAKRVLLSLSDPSTEPVPVAPGKGAAGAWSGPAQE